MDRTNQTNEVVVLVHGLGVRGFVMYPLGRWLRRGGYGTVVWSYASLFHSIERHGEMLLKRLKSLDDDERISRLHLVTHSMGCIVARQALLAERPRKMGRWVMLAPPNQGSAVASFFGPRLRWCFPTIDQLASRHDSFVNRLPEPDEFEIGVIAARVDWQVGILNTRLVCQHDHIVVGGTHSQLLCKPGVAGEIAEFLRSGQFTAANRRDFVCGA